MRTEKRVFRTLPLTSEQLREATSSLSLIREDLQFYLKPSVSGYITHSLLESIQSKAVFKTAMHLNKAAVTLTNLMPSCVLDKERKDLIQQVEAIMHISGWLVHLMEHGYLPADEIQIRA